MTTRVEAQRQVSSSDAVLLCFKYASIYPLEVKGGHPIAQKPSSL